MGTAMKMWGYCPWIPNSSFFLLVLLLLILPINGRFYNRWLCWRNSYGSALASRSSNHHQSLVPSHILHRRDTALELCEGVTDVYILLDKSTTLLASWPYVQQFAVDMANSIKNPQVRICLITFSCKGNVILPPTSNREEIQKGLERVKNTMLAGKMHVEKAYQKVNSEMKKVKAKGLLGSSMVVSVQHRPFMLESQQKAVKHEMYQLRKLGASIHTVGINIVNTSQILEFADRPEDGFPLKQGFTYLPQIIPELSSRVCPKFTSVDNATVCAKESYKVVLRGHGFLYGKGNDRIICRFKMSDSKVVDESPISVGKYSLTCPGPKMEQIGQEAIVELSLDKGKSFLSNNIKITSKDCALTVTSAPEQPSTTETPSTSENPPATTTSPRPIITSKPVKIFVKNKRFIFLPIGLSLLLALLLLGCLWQLCCPPPVKKQRHVPQLEKESGKTPTPPPTPPPAPAPVNVYPTIIICCCACRGVCVSKDRKGNIIVCNNDHSRYNQVPLTWSPLSEQGRYSNFAFRKALCTQDPCCSNICLGPGQECLPIECCSQCDPLSATCSRPPSRMLPFLLPPAQINQRTVFSLPPL